MLPQALQTLARATKATSSNISKAESWLLGCGWALVGNETEAEKTTLNETFCAARDWLASWLDGAEPYWLVLVGLSGVGKTLLVRRICEYIENWGKNVYARTMMPPGQAMVVHGAAWGFHWSEVQFCHPFQKWPRLVPHCEANQTQLACARKNWALAIDDLKPQTGQETEIEGSKESLVAVKPKQFEITAAGDLLDDRWRKWTIVTSNLTRKQLAVFWDIRISSRLMRDTVFIDLTGMRDFNLRREALKK